MYLDEARRLKRDPLFANAQKTRREDLVREIAGRAEELRGLLGKDTDQERLCDTIHRIESADWYRRATGPERPGCSTWSGGCGRRRPRSSGAGT